MAEADALGRSTSEANALGHSTSEANALGRSTPEANAPESTVYVILPQGVVWCSVCQSTASPRWVRVSIAGGPTYCWRCFMHMLGDWLDSARGRLVIEDRRP